MGITQKEIMYRVILLSEAEKSFEKLDSPVQKKLAKKIDWLIENAENVIHHPLTSLPDDLRGLCRMKGGRLSDSVLDLYGI